MRYPPSEHLGRVQGPDGKEYELEFYGEDEGAAVITTTPPMDGQFHETEEIHREDAADPKDAKAKLAAWRHANGWPV